MSAPNPVIDLSRNQKQADYFNEVMAAVAGLSNKRFFAYGGAVRGGKTFVTLFILMVLCRKFPGSRWHVIRATLPDLKKTTVPSFEKLAPTGVTIHRDPGNWYAPFPNGSAIFFTSENISQDPELKSFLGLETNGIFIEQAEEASRKLWEKAIERAGSWYIDPMPPALTFLTFNPTLEWPDEIFCEPYYEGELKDPYFYMPALPNDNPFVTADQWTAWQQMDSRLYRAMIEGDRTALISGEGRAFWTFDKSKHVKPLDFLPDTPVAHLSFDQNVVPYITMLAAQCVYLMDGTLQIRIFKEYCLKHPDSTTKTLCNRFLLDFGPRVNQVFIYGDASGSKRDTREAMSDYRIAETALKSKWGNRSNRVQTSNPQVRKRVLFLCAIFEGKIPGIEIVIDKGCYNLIQDMLMVKSDANGGKLKQRVTENGVSFEKWGHTSDALEYLVTSLCPAQFKDFEKLIQ